METESLESQQQAALNCIVAQKNVNRKWWNSSVAQNTEEAFVSHCCQQRVLRSPEGLSLLLAERKNQKNRTASNKKILALSALGLLLVEERCCWRKIRRNRTKWLKSLIQQRQAYGAFPELNLFQL